MLLYIILFIYIFSVVKEHKASLFQAQWGEKNQQQQQKRTLIYD